MAREHMEEYKHGRFRSTQSPPTAAHSNTPTRTPMRLKTVVNLASCVLWALSIAGYVGVSIPMLTSPDAILYIEGNELEGGWGFN